MLANTLLKAMSNTLPDYKDTNVFLIFWDCYGLESCVDITEHMREGNAFEHENLFERIKNPEEDPHNEHVHRVNHMINSMSMRARFNPQRNYELYFIHTVKSITTEQFETMFAEDPQSAAELIRERGQQLLSHRSTTERVIS